MTLEPERPEPGSTRTTSVERGERADRGAMLTLEARVAATPADAQLRGALFHVVARAVTDVASSSSPPPPRRAYVLYPVRDFLVFVDAAARRLGPTPSLGLQRCFAHAVGHLRRSGASGAFGRPREAIGPLALLQRLERSRALIANYGRWRVTGGEGDVTIDVRDEWVWIGEAWVPAIASIFEFCRRSDVRIEHEPHGPFAARLRVRW